MSETAKFSSAAQHFDSIFRRRNTITPTLVLLNIIGGVCLLLWGLRTVKLGMTRAFGADLHKMVSAGTKNRFKAFFSGIVVTGLLQSSTATALIVATFCGRALMPVSAGLAVMLGADVGTTLVAQVLSFDVSWLPPLLLLAGFVMFSMYEKNGRLGHVGKFIIGLGLMLFALSVIKQAAIPLEHSTVLQTVLQSLQKDPIIAILLTALLTWLAHSSLAIVLLLASFVSTGILPIDVGMAMVLGANLGGAFAPIFATMKSSREACRVPVGNLIMRGIGIIAVLPCLEMFDHFSSFFGADPVRAILNFHTAFNIALAVLFLPFTGRLAKLCEKIIVEDKNQPDPGRPMYLDEKQMSTPSVALASAMRETLRMADIVQNMLENTILALQRNDEVLVREIVKRDDVLDRIYKSIKMYMARLSQEEMDAHEAHQYVQILGFSTNIENTGDLIDKSLMDMARKKIKERTKFSEKGWSEIREIHRFVMDTVRLAQSVFVSNDPKLARQLVEGKEKLRNEEAKATAAHLERIREGIPETIATSSLHLDIIRDLRRINSYMASVAYPILEESGQIRASRLRPEKKSRKKDAESENGHSEEGSGTQAPA